MLKLRKTTVSYLLTKGAITTRMSFNSDFMRHFMNEQAGPPTSPHAHSSLSEGPNGRRRDKTPPPNQRLQMNNNTLAMEAIVLRRERGVEKIRHLSKGVVNSMVTLPPASSKSATPLPATSCASPNVRRGNGEGKA